MRQYSIVLQYAVFVCFLFSSCLYHSGGVGGFFLVEFIELVQSVHNIIAFMGTDISALSSVHPKVEIGEGVVVGPFCVVEEGVTLGDGVRLHSHVSVYSGTTIGKGTQIYPYASIGAEPQDLKFNGEKTFTQIGENTVIRECVTISRGTQEAERTKVGNSCLLMAYVHVAHDCSVGDHCILSNSTQLAGHVSVHDWAIMGGMCGVLQFTRIGTHSFVSGGTHVSKDVLPYTKVMYTPGNYAGINITGLRRRGFSSESMLILSDIYRLIYNADLNLSQAIEKIQQSIPDCAEKTQILAFIQSTKNGVIKKSVDPD